MRKVSSYRELEVGKIYNRVYVGPNKAYAKINGRQTFEVTATEPVFQYQILRDKFGDCASEEIRSGVITSSRPDLLFKEVELFEVDDKSEWFIKSEITTLKAALDEGLITIEDIKGKSSSKEHTSRAGCKSGPAFYTQFGVEGKSSDNPLLQTIYICWMSYEELEEGFAEFGVHIC